MINKLSDQKIVWGLFVGMFFMSCSTPYPEVKWIEDYPGAGDRYVTFTPVLKSDNNVVLGPVLGADYGKLHFEDINNDGNDEVIIETDLIFDFGEFYSSERHVLESYKDSLGMLKFKLIKSEKVK